MNIINKTDKKRLSLTRKISGKHRGQFTIIAAILISVLVITIGLSAAQLAIFQQNFRHEPASETVTEITADLNRELTHALSTASKTYNDTGQKDLADAAFCNNVTFWQRSALASHSEIGLQMNLEPAGGGNVCDVTPTIDWSTNRGITQAFARFSLNATTYGLTGWVGQDDIARVLDVDPNSFESDLTTTTFNFTLKDGGGQPITGLATSNLFVSMNPAFSGNWINTNIEKVEYFGAGKYRATVTPSFQLTWLQKKVTVITPGENIYVSTHIGVPAPAYVTLDCVKMPSGQECTPAPDIFFNFKPYSVRTTMPPIGPLDPPYPVLLNFTKRGGSNFFNNWEFSPPGAVKIISGDLNDKQIYIEIEANATITAFISSTETPQTTTLTVRKVLVPSDDPGSFDLKINGTTYAFGVGDGGSTPRLEVPVGTHIVTEEGVAGTQLSDYTTVISGDCDSSGYVTLADGQDGVCTITNIRNNVIKTTLTVNKVVVPSSDTGKFNLLINGAEQASNIGDGGTTGPVELSAGIYTVSESFVPPTNPLDYTQIITGACDSSGHVTLAAGDNKVCTITNILKVPTTLTVIKDIVPSDNPGLFNLQINESTYAANVGNGGTTGPIQLSPGTYVVSETPVPPTDLAKYSAVISGDCAPDGSVTLAAGDSKVCRITNVYNYLAPPRLTVNKVVSPGSDTGRFNLTINGTAYAENVGNGGSTGPIQLPSGTYTVGETAGSETSLSLYTTVISGDCASDGSVTLNNGDYKTCTITNVLNGISTLTVTKIVEPGSDTGRFYLLIDSEVEAENVGSGGSTGPVQVGAGTHMVYELAGTDTSLDNYNSVIGGDCDSNGQVTIVPGDHKTCTITNTLKTVSQNLTVIWSLYTSNNSTYNNDKFDITFDGVNFGQGNYGKNLHDNTTLVRLNIAVGSHILGATPGSGNKGTYTVYYGGDCSSIGTVTVTTGLNRVCTIAAVLNSIVIPTLTVNKVVIPASDAGLFNLTIDGSTYAANVGNGGTTSAQVISNGTHTVGETGGTGTALSDYTTVIGGDCAPDGSVTLAGDNKVCTITNTKIPKLTVNKVVVPSSDTGKFNLTINGLTYAENVGDGGSTGKIKLYSGTFTVSELAGTDTNLLNYTTVIGGDCASDGSVTLSAGDDKICTITNVLKPTSIAKLAVEKIVVPSGDAGKFNLLIDGKVNASNVGDGGSTGSLQISLGSHTVSETAGTGTSLSDYTTVISGDCASDGSVTLSAGDNKTCIITNVLKTSSIPRLTVNKVVVPSSAAGKFNLTINGVTYAENVGDGGTTGPVNLFTGTFTVGEEAGTGTNLSDYTTVISGACDSSGQVTLAAGDNKVCTITNLLKIVTSITVNKILSPADDLGKFNLTIDGVTWATNVGNGGTTGAISVSPGTHIVGELAGIGTDLSYYTTVYQDGCDSSGQIIVVAGENKVCTIVNVLSEPLVWIQSRNATNPGDAGNIGTILFHGVNSSLPYSELLAPGAYSLSYEIGSQWEGTTMFMGYDYSGGVYVQPADSTPTTLYVLQGGGTLTIWYAKIPCCSEGGGYNSIYVTDPTQSGLSFFMPETSGFLPGQTSNGEAKWGINLTMTVPDNMLIRFDGPALFYIAVSSPNARDVTATIWYQPPALPLYENTAPTLPVSKYAGNDFFLYKFWLGHDAENPISDFLPGGGELTLNIIVTYDTPPFGTVHLSYGPNDPSYIYITTKIIG